MSRQIWIVVLLAVLVPCNLLHAAQRLVLSDDSYGAIRFGENLSTTERALGERAKPANRESSCDFVTFQRYPGIRFMVEKNVITRADVISAAVPNALGIKIGTSLAEVKRRYPKAIIMPHKYDENGHYVIFRSANGKRAIVFEEGGDKITSVRAGLEPSVEYVEGCL